MLHEALDRWILGEEPFTARLDPDFPATPTYDQLMRLDEWIGGADMSGEVHPLEGEQAQRGRAARQRVAVGLGGHRQDPGAVGARAAAAARARACGRGTSCA